MTHGPQGSRGWHWKALRVSLFSFLSMNGKLVFWDLPFNSNQTVGMSPLHYGRCLLTTGLQTSQKYTVGYCHVQQQNFKKKKGCGGTVSTEIGYYISPSFEMWKEQVFSCNSWLHRYCTSVHTIRWMQTTLVLPHPTSWHLTTARSIMEKKTGSRFAAETLLS